MKDVCNIVLDKINEFYIRETDFCNGGEVDNIILIIGVCLVIIVFYYYNRGKMKSAGSDGLYYRGKDHVDTMREEALEFNNKIKELNCIPEIQTPLSLKNGEKAYLQDRVQLYELRSKSNYHRGGVGF